MASLVSDDGVSAAAAAVCCMCGDHGLPHELFRCDLCRLRMQHRYCSDLYPRVPGPYRSCNWCLIREDRGGGGGSPVKAPAAAGSAIRRGLNDCRVDDRDQQEERPCGGGCTSRSAFSADPGKPVKKTKKGCERVVQRPVVTTAAKKRRQVQVVQRPVVTTAAKKRREVQAGTGGKARFRVKVRRYKLLAEVIC